MNATCGTAHLALAMSVVVAALSGCEGSRPQGTSTPSQAAAETPPARSPVQLIPYEVAKEEPYDTPLKTQILEHGWVLKVPTEPELRHLLATRAELIRKRTGFVHHPSPTNIGVYVYETAEQAHAEGLWMGMLFWRPVDGPPTITINQDRLANAGKPSTVRWGMPEATRREIFVALVRAEDRGQAEAERKRPVPEIGSTLDQFKAQSALARKLKDQYEKQVRVRYGLTEEIADSITFEALDRGWPLPRRER